MCFFAGGTRFSEQGFGISAAQLNSTLLVIAVIAVLLPAAFDFAVTSGPADDTRLQFDILHLSHGIAILLLISKCTIILDGIPATHADHSLH
jgi:Ca2+:H+ antiporter